MLNAQFSSVFTRENMDNQPALDASPYDPMTNIIISVNGVRKLMVGLNPDKASDPDKISAWFLKSMAEPLAPALPHSIKHPYLKAGSLKTGNQRS